MIDKNLISDSATIDIAGGEPTLYYKFNEALEMLLSINIKNIVIHTNGILYNKIIEKGIKNGKINLIVSIDAGTKKNS